MVKRVLVIEGKRLDRKQKKKKFELSKKCVGAGIVCVSVAIVLVVMVNALLKKQQIEAPLPHEETFNYRAIPERVCKTEQCKVAGEYFKKNMNLSADPCQNFFNYVCGGWAQQNKKYFKNSIWTVDTRQRTVQTEKIIGLLSSRSHNDSPVVSEAKRFFQKCVATDFAKEKDGIKKVIKHFGGFPLYDKSEETYDSKLQWFQRSARSIRYFGIYDHVNGGFTQAIILNVVFHPVLSLVIEKPNSYYKKPEFYSTASYSGVVLSSVCGVLKSSCTKNKNEMKAVERQVKEMVAFQAIIAECVFAADESAGDMKVLDFEKKFPKLHIHKFLKELFTHSGRKITENTLLHVKSLAYWEKVNELLKNTPVETINNLIGWSNMETLQYTTSPRMILTDYKYLSARNNQEKKQTNVCFVQTDIAFKFAVSRLFVDNLFREDTKRRATKTVKLFQKAFIKTIRDKKWLGESTKKEAIKKISLMKLNIGYPNWLKHDDALERYYSLPKSTSNLSFIETLGKHISFNNAQTLLKNPNPIFQNHPWESIAPYVSNAQYIAYQNTLVLPPTQCIPPLFWSNATKSLLFSSASATIGHKMAHSVDIYGSKFDAYGNKRNWWDDNSKKRYDEVVDCLKKQYSGTLDPLSNKHLRGERTVGEDIADILGLRLAYKAYLLSGAADERLPGFDHVSGHKLFFIGAGMSKCAHYTAEGMERTILTDKHSPNNYRAFMPSSNLFEFSKIFRCSLGSQMNRKDKCMVN